MRVTLIVPTYNPGNMWREWIMKMRNSSYALEQLIVVDSDSADSTNLMASSEGYSIITVNPLSFNHGGTRNYAVSQATPSDIIVFLTQDALLAAPESLQALLAPFNDPEIAAVCGRQLPHCDANPLAAHARYFNYPEVSQIKSSNDIAELGLKVAFMSNSFAAYRRDVFERLGGFPDNTILAEDMYLAAKMILSGYKVAYCAEATVYHSHNYTPVEEFQRYFDIGVFHACEPWLQKELGGASGEGFRFVKSELRYLWQYAPLWIPRALLTTACKLLGYKLGKSYKHLPKSWCFAFSMYKSYWLQQDK